MGQGLRFPVEREAQNADCVVIIVSIYCPVRDEGRERAEVEKGRGGDERKGGRKGTGGGRGSSELQEQEEKTTRMMRKMCREEDEGGK